MSPHFNKLYENIPGLSGSRLPELNQTASDAFIRHAPEVHDIVVIITITPGR